jgi:hypothetical protein
LKYSSGEEVLIGDVVTADKSKGVVACVIDTNQFSEEHPEEQWGYLGRGMMVETIEMGLVHYTGVNPDVILVARKQ